MLDTPTLLAVISVVDIFLAILVLLIWHRDHRYAGIREIRIGLPLFAASAAVSALRDVLPKALCIALGQGGMLFGAVILLNGILILLEKRTLWLLHLSVMTLIAIPFLYYLLVVPSTPIRNGLGSLWATFLCFSTFLALVHGPRPPGKSMTHLLLALLLLGHSLVEAGRGIFAPFLDPHIDWQKPSLILTVYYLEFVFYSVSITMLILQIVNERLREDLAESEERIASAFQVANDGFILFDRQNRLLMANQRFRELFPDAMDALQPGATITTTFARNAERFGLEPSWLERPAEDWRQPGQLDRQAYLPDGRCLHVTGRTARGGNLVLCWTDITAFKQAEQIMAQELERERELAMLQRSFVAMASHQFRTPLTIIDLNAQLLEPQGIVGSPQSELHPYATRIRRTVKRMVRLIDTMLSTASAEAGTIKLKCEPVDIAGLLREICERMREIAHNRVIECAIGNLPTRILCDPGLIDQVLSNLLSNAVKYSEAPSGIFVTAWADEEAVEFEVADAGVGISSEDQIHIFERFFRAANVADISGTGIGLTLARHIVELHGGSIRVKSTLGQGSTFTVRLPIGSPM